VQKHLWSFLIFTIDYIKLKLLLLYKGFYRSELEKTQIYNMFNLISSRVYNKYFGFIEMPKLRRVNFETKLYIYHKFINIIYI